jgi:hypothetical protein
MAARLTDRQKKKILADYVQTNNYCATAKINGVSATTVKNLVRANADIINKITYYADAIDRLMKINMRLIAKFKTHLHKEYGDAIEDIAKMFDTLYAEQQKETPLMWYEYCYGVKDTGK